MKRPLMALAVLVVFGFIITALAQDAGKGDQDKIKISTSIKQVEGEVSAIGKMAIAIVYQKDQANNKEYEISFPIDTNLKVVHKNKLSDITVGDTVNIEYEEQITEHPGGKRQSSRVAKTITFLRPAQKVPETAQPQDQGADEGLLPLKGTK